MSTKKVEKKPTNAADIVSGKDKKDTLTLKGGETVKREGVFAVNKDGEVERINSTDLLTHDRAAITVMYRGKDGEQRADTYLCMWRRDDKNNYVFNVLTGKGLDDEAKHDEEMTPKDFKLLGRGDPIHAAIILDNMWNAYGSQFGINKAYRIVRIELDYKTKQWMAIVAPVMSVLS